MYGITLDSILDVINAGKVGVLSCQAQVRKLKLIMEVFTCRSVRVATFTLAK